MTEVMVTEEQVEKAYRNLFRETEQAGYHLNPDIEFTKKLVRGLLVNEQRYGYQACPCRLASGKRGEDLDIICPCDYRDPDLDDFGTCYCALYVTGPVLKGTQKLIPIPERRPPRSERTLAQAKAAAVPTLSALPYPVWRCKVCGYLCAREEPPQICPICRVTKDRFERFF
jgi:ferredoxin-thioredoxin reductase catalytic subunit